MPTKSDGTIIKGSLRIPEWVSKPVTDFKFGGEPEPVSEAGKIETQADLDIVGLAGRYSGTERVIFQAKAYEGLASSPFEKFGHKSSGGVSHGGVSFGGNLLVHTTVAEQLAKLEAAARQFSEVRKLSEIFAQFDHHMAAAAGIDTSNLSDNGTKEITIEAEPLPQSKPKGLRRRMPSPATPTKR